MSWLRFGISASGAAAYLLSLPEFRPVGGHWEALIGVAFLYSIPHIFIAPGRPTYWTRLRILINTILDFVLVTATVSLSGGVNSTFVWLYALTIVGNVLRYGDVAGFLTVAGSMLAVGVIGLSNGSTPATLLPALVFRLGFFLILYFMVAHLSRYAVRMEGVARRGAQLMEAIGRIGVPVNLAGNISLALEAVCEEITILFDVDHVFIWLVRDNELVGAATTGSDKEDFLVLHRPLDDPDLFGARVVRERRPMFMNNVRHQGDGLDARLAHTFGIQAVAGIPLIHGDASVGAMLLADCRNASRFREEDLAPAMLLGNLAATALYHASMHDQLRQAYTRTLETLGEAIDVRDAYTGGHSQRIKRYAEHVAQAVGAPPEMLEHIRTAAMMHDIGKIGIPDGILLKPGHLTERETEIMKSHSLIGARLLRTAGFPDDVVSIVRHLHERYDGQGYPGSLRGEAIPLGSRILAVADTYEAMTSDRVYRSALDPEDAFTELRRFGGIQFDPAIVEAFVTSWKSLTPPQTQEEQEPGSVADPAGVFSSVTAYLLNRFGQFAGEQVVGTIVSRIAAKGTRSGWSIHYRDAKLEVETRERQDLPEARREVLSWLLENVEQLGGARIALHLLTEAVEQLSPPARDVYRVLLSPAMMDETANGEQAQAIRSSAP